MAKAKILVVEDDAIVAKDIQYQLKSWGFSVPAIVSSGEKAIQMAKENTPDLVLMDIVLKGEMDGIEAAEIIRSRFEIPVIFLTAHADEKRLERAKLTNPYGYILKPFQDKDLEVTIELALYVAKVDAERKRAEESLKLANEKLLKEHNQRKILSKRLIELLEKDRHDVAMELHDSIGQTLTSLKLNLETIDHRFKPIDTELGAMIKAAEKRTIQAIREIKNISHGLMPGILDALGLLPSLRELFNEIQEHRGIKINFFNKNVPKRFDQAKELAIYRIVQEALTNIVKHAKAKNVFVNLSKRGNAIFLSVEDDGIGFDQEEAMKISKGKGPLGLIIMRERAIQLNGELTIESQVGKGANLLMEMPI